MDTNSRIQVFQLIYHRLANYALKKNTELMTENRNLEFIEKKKTTNSVTRRAVSRITRNRG